MQKCDHFFIENSPGIGDLIMMTPVLRKLKEMYPSCKITVASWNPYSLQAIERIPYIDDVHAIRSNFWGRIQSFLNFIHQDSIILNSYQGALVRLAKFAGVKKRAGNCKDKYMKTSLFTHPFPYTNGASTTFYETDYLAKKIGESLDIEIDIDDYQCDISQPNQEEENNASKILTLVGHIKGKDYVVVSPFGNCSVDLTLESIETIIRYWTEKDYDVVIIGKKSETFEHWYKSRLALFRGNAYNICGMTSIMEMIDVIKNAKAVVALDSGPVHIACALKKHTAGIFTSNSLTEWKPKEYCYPIKLPLDCSSPCNNCDCVNKKCAEFNSTFLNNKLNQFEEILVAGADT